MTNAQAAYLLGVLSGALIAVLAAWPVGYLRERARQRAAEHPPRQDRKRAEAKEAADALARANAEHASAQDLELIRRARVGTRFRWRGTPDDVGMIGTVLRLSRQHPRLFVVVQWESPPGRNPDERDDSTTEPTSIEWRVLNEPEAAQRHWTARCILDSYNDEDGWIQYERLPREG